MKKQVIITVSGGVADVAVCPTDVEVQVLDFDDLGADPARTISYWPDTLKNYYDENCEKWGEPPLSTLIERGRSSNNK